MKNQKVFPVKSEFFLPAVAKCMLKRGPLIDCLGVLSIVAGSLSYNIKKNWVEFNPKTSLKTEQTGNKTSQCMVASLIPPQKNKTGSWRRATLARSVLMWLHSSFDPEIWARLLFKCEQLFDDTTKGCLTSEIKMEQWPVTNSVAF